MFIRYRIAILGATLLLLVPVAGRHSLAQGAPAEIDETIRALEEKVADFLEGVSGGQTQNAYTELLAGSELLKQTEALAELVKQTGELDGKYGRYKGFERIAARRVGKDLVLMRYLYKCQNFPVVWYFAFYRTDSEGPAENADWRAVIVRFDTNLELLGFGAK